MLRLNFPVSYFIRRCCSSTSYKKCFDIMPSYDKNIKSELEKHWKDKLFDSKKDYSLSEKMYVLSMFPYPSGNLHMGHMRVYTVADTIARYYRMCKKQVIFPMGWDSFGLPAENAAFERSFEPKDWTLKNIAEMKRQMNDHMTLSIDWEREVSTCDPKYFKWTQWLFARLFEKGFAYQRTDLVNWDPVDCTVLADELVDNEGRSWRSGAVVERRPLQQWCLRTTAFTESLLAGLQTLNGREWRHVVDCQRGWLGTMDGCYVELDLVDLWQNGRCLERLSVFTSSPVAVLTDMVAFVEINKDNVWWRHSLTKSPDYPAVHNRLAVRHPLSKRLIPIIRNPNLEFNPEECLSARFGIPIVNLDDGRLASRLGITVSHGAHLAAYNRIKGSAWSTSEGVVLNDHLEPSLNEEALVELQAMKRGGYRCSKLRTDWLISRQRYWGTPIPIIHCPDCGPVLVPNEQLPVELPDFSECQSSTKDRGTTSPLAAATSWVTVPCPSCGNSDCRRETDTMDTFVDSSWYYLRHLDPENGEELCDGTTVSQTMPVDVYVGGIEHAIRHLFYARFVAHFLHQYGGLQWTGAPEPFAKFLPIGLLLGRTYQTDNGKFVAPDKVTYPEDGNGKKAIHVDSGEPLRESWEKMSKSKHNGVDPETVIDKYGLDLSRLILLGNVGPDRSRKWQDDSVATGIVNWEKRMWRLVKTVVDNSDTREIAFVEEDALLMDSGFLGEYQFVHRSLIREYSIYTFSSVIALLQRLTSVLLKVSTQSHSHQSILFHRSLFNLIVLLHPISPLLSSELWAQLSSAIRPSESIFVATEDRYVSLCGQWSYDLTRPVWEQSILDLVEMYSHQDRDTQCQSEEAL